MRLVPAKESSPEVLDPDPVVAVCLGYGNYNCTGNSGIRQQPPRQC